MPHHYFWLYPAGVISSASLTVKHNFYTAKFLLHCTFRRDSLICVTFTGLQPSVMILHNVQCYNWQDWFTESKTVERNWKEAFLNQIMWWGHEGNLRIWVEWGIRHKDNAAAEESKIKCTQQHHYYNLSAT